MVEARKRLTNLPEELAKHPEIGVVKITRRGKPVLAVVSWELYESVSETLAIMSDPEMMVAVRRRMRDLEQETLIPGRKSRTSSVFDLRDCHHGYCPRHA
jgi:PHD/YefM family antitoxin component YafN of YafNO toxin-antitoxin module